MEEVYKVVFYRIMGTLGHWMHNECVRTLKESET